METGDGIRGENVNGVYGRRVHLQRVAAGVGVDGGGRLGPKGIGRRFDARVIEVSPGLNLCNGVEFESAAEPGAWYAGALNLIEQADSRPIHGKEIVRACNGDDRNNGQDSDRDRRNARAYALLMPAQKEDEKDGNNFQEVAIDNPNRRRARHQQAAVGQGKRQQQNGNRAPRRSLRFWVGGSAEFQKNLRARDSAKCE